MGDSYLWSAAASGSWDLASNWIDTTTDEDPAPAAPGANDSVTVDAAAGGATRVITGMGNSASLSIAGPTLLSGQFTTGALDFDGSTNPTSNSRLALGAGDTLTVAGNATVDDADFGGFDITGGTVAIGGDLAFDAYSSVNEVSDGGVLTVGGSVISSFPVVSISGTTGARIRLASVSGAISLSVDSASSLEIGAAGGAALGAITVDPGASVTMGGPPEEPSCLTAPTIVDDGAIAATEGQSLTLDGGLAGSGQVDIGAGSVLSIEGVAAASQNTIDFIGAGAVLTISGSALDASGAFLPLIAGFSASDAIDFAGTATSASYADGALTLYDGAAAVATLKFSGDYAEEPFTTLALASGTQILLDPNSDNIPPTVKAPMEVTVSSGEPLAISGVHVADSASGAILSVTLSDGGGLLSLTTIGPGGGMITGYGNVTIVGTLAQINADLQTLTYQNSTVGSDSILFSANDGLGGVTDAEILVSTSSVSASDAVDGYAANPAWGPFAIVDSATDIAANLDGLETVATAGKIVSIAATGGAVTASVSATSADGSALGKIVGGFEVSDGAADVAASFDALNADANVTSIVLIDGGAPALSLDVAQALGDTAALGKIAGPYTIAIADTAPNISANHAAIATLIGEGQVSSLTRANVAGQAYSSYEQLFDGGVFSGTDYFYNATGQPYSSYEYDYSAGNALIGSKFNYTGIAGQAYTGEQVDYNGVDLLTSIAFTGVPDPGYSSFQYDYVGGVFAGSQFNYTAVPAGATYSSFETDYNQANQYTDAKFLFANIEGQSYTAEEVDLDADGALSAVLLTGFADQAYSSLKLDYSGGTYEGYQAYYTAAGQPYTSDEVDVSAAGQLEKVVYSGMTSTPYSSVEQDFSGGALADAIYDFTNVAGASYNAYQVEDNASGVALQETLDLNSGGHDLIALTSGQTLTSLGDDVMTGNGATTFALDAIYGADTIANLTGGDIVSMPNSEFASFSALSASASFGSGAAVTKAGDGDTLTLKGVTTPAALQALSGDFTFHA